MAKNDNERERYKPGFINVMKTVGIVLLVAIVVIYLMIIIMYLCGGSKKEAASMISGTPMLSNWLGSYQEAFPRIVIE